MPLTVGGGVRTLEDMRALLLAGADKVSINTAAVAGRNSSREAAEKFGSQCIVVAIDAKRVGRRGGWEIFTHGGRNADRDRRGRACARALAELGAGEMLLTSMDRDGTKAGYDLELTRADRRCGARAGDRLAAAWARWTIWSTGVTEGHASAVLAASIFHFGEATIAEAKAALAAAGIAVRA